MIPDLAAEYDETDEGWSTDDELAESERHKLLEARDAVAETATHLFDDTRKEFSSIQVAKSKLETWKYKYPQVCYLVSFCLLFPDHICVQPRRLTKMPMRA